MLRDRFKSFGYAFKGMRHLVMQTPNARIHLFFTILVVAAGFFFEVSLSEWCVLVICIAMVFAAEAFNSALEELTDLVSPEIHPVAGNVKDLAAGAVLFTAIGAATVGIIIFLPKVLEVF
ncbi:MAG: diacylglycerol kinase family protein [Bacteroidota bacterium]